MEKNYFTADITRTFPVGGRFSSAQRDVYERVLDVEKKMIDFVQAGVEFKALQDKTVELLTQHMIELQLLKGSVEENIKSLAYKKYYPHGVSHYLGMDVHDVPGASKPANEEQASDPRLELHHLALEVHPRLGQNDRAISSLVSPVDGSEKARRH